MLVLSTLPRSHSTHHHNRSIHHTEGSNLPDSSFVFENRFDYPSAGRVEGVGVCACHEVRR